MLKYRLIFGPIMLIALVLLFYLDNRLDQVQISGTIWQTVFAGRNYLPAGLLMLVAFLALVPLGAAELRDIFRAKGIDANPLMVTIAGVVGLTSIYIIPYRMNSQSAIAIVATLMIVLFLATLIEYSWRGRTQGAVAVAGVTLFAMVYMGLLPGFYVAIRRWHSAWVVAAIIVITKSCDIGAYFTGRAIGRHKLIPWLSPGKTWEGLAGGVVLAALTAAGAAVLFNKTGMAGVWTRAEGQRVFQPLYYPIDLAALAGAVIALVGQFGDLCASLFKRDAGIKDSGQSIPGFGGVIDVADSPIVVAPLAYWLLTLAASMD